MENWCKQNQVLLALLREKQAPTPEQVINARNVLWEQGFDVDVNLFGHLIEFAVLHEKK